MEPPRRCEIRLRPCHATIKIYRAPDLSARGYFHALSSGCATNFRRPSSPTNTSSDLRSNRQSVAINSTPLAPRASTAHRPHSSWLAQAVRNPVRLPIVRRCCDSPRHSSQRIQCWPRAQDEIHFREDDAGVRLSVRLFRTGAQRYAHRSERLSAQSAREPHP